ncbi:MAG: alpha,alpha-trehalase, partial [Victivallaceae bacterium]|nr:alpha,alpha-trehalase [Victivallaceae bacterium]
ARTNRLMNDRLWDDETRLYIDFDIKSGKRSGVLSSVASLPSISGAPTGEMASRMVALLADPQKFGTPLPIPSVARDTDGFSTDMWRGPVWTNINMLVCEGLRQYGYGAMADEIESKTRSAIEKYFKEFGTFYEYYDADGKLPPPSMDRKGYNSPVEVYHQPLRDYGWTAALYIDSRLRK